MQWKEFQIYRWSPDSEDKPKYVNYKVDINRCAARVFWRVRPARSDLMQQQVLAAGAYTVCYQCACVQSAAVGSRQTRAARSVRMGVLWLARVQRVHGAVHAVERCLPACQAT